MNIPSLKTRKFSSNDSDATTITEQTSLSTVPSRTGFAASTLAHKTSLSTKIKKEDQIISQNITNSRVSFGDNDTLPIDFTCSSSENEYTSDIEQLFTDKVDAKGVHIDSNWIILQFPRTISSHGTLRVHSSGRISLDVPYDSDCSYPVLHNLVLGTTTRFPQQLVMIQNSLFIPLGHSCDKVVAKPQLPFDIVDI